MELNPNNRVTTAARDQWHKIVALMMIKLNLTEVTITQADLEACHAMPEMPIVMLHDCADGLRVKMITQAEAGQLLERERVGSAS